MTSTCPLQIRKYPRTVHIETSRVQPGDEEKDSVPFTHLRGRNLVVEEKVDGANSGISFDSDGSLRLQSRGHFLTGGPRERHFDLFKRWSHTDAQQLREVLGDRYVLYGEWLYAKHTVFYDALPHYFLEFDVLDTVDGEFLSTPRRRDLLSRLPVCSVGVLHQGHVQTLADLTDLVDRSWFKSDHWREALRLAAENARADPDLVMFKQTDQSDLMEGLYVKVEDDDRVLGRYKWIRSTFLQTVVASDTHWLDRTIVPNQLLPGTDLFRATAT